VEQGVWKSFLHSYFLYKCFFCSTVDHFLETLCNLLIITYQSQMM
jgi:hypothetical protein